MKLATYEIEVHHNKLGSSWNSPLMLLKFTTKMSQLNSQLNSQFMTHTEKNQLTHKCVRGFIFDSAGNESESSEWLSQCHWFVVDDLTNDVHAFYYHISVLWIWTSPLFVQRCDMRPLFPCKRSIAAMAAQKPPHAHYIKSFARFAAKQKYWMNGMATKELLPI